MFVKCEIHSLVGRFFTATGGSFPLPVCCAVLALAAGWIGFPIGVAAAQDSYTIEGKLDPPYRAAITLYGATTPFNRTSESDPAGRFRYRGVDADLYTVAVFVPGKGEVRRTIVVSPSLADKKRRVQVTIPMDAENLRRGPAVGVSLTTLAVPAKAKREYDRVQTALAKRDVQTAEHHLHKATEIHPAYGEAWNNLGTIAYQTQRYALAADYFRKALEVNDKHFEAMVNLGGVLINLNQMEDAVTANQRAIREEPNDALAHVQLGIALFGLRRFTEAETHLRRGIELDPAHFSQPHLLLARVRVANNDPRDAADILEQFLTHYPDHPQAAVIRKDIESLRSSKAGRTATQGTVPAP